MFCRGRHDIVKDAMRPFLCGLLLFGLTSCGVPANREELAKQILKTDPAFASVLDRHRELASKIDTYERELALKRSTVQRTIDQLRKDLIAATATVRSKTADAKKRMEPEQERLKLALSMAGEELRAKRAQRASLGRSISQLKKAVKNAGSAWSAEEHAHQEAQVDDMVKDAKRLDQEMDVMKEHVRLLKVKLLLINL